MECDFINSMQTATVWICTCGTSNILVSSQSYITKPWKNDFSLLRTCKCPECYTRLCNCFVDFDLIALHSISLRFSQSLSTQQIHLHACLRLVIAISHDNLHPIGSMQISLEHTKPCKSLQTIPHAGDAETHHSGQTMKF